MRTLNKLLRKAEGRFDTHGRIVTTPPDVFDNQATTLSKEYHQETAQDVHSGRRNGAL